MVRSKAFVSGPFHAFLAIRCTRTEFGLFFRTHLIVIFEKSEWRPLSFFLARALMSHTLRSRLAPGRSVQGPPRVRPCRLVFGIPASHVPGQTSPDQDATWKRWVFRFFCVWTIAASSREFNSTPERISALGATSPADYYIQGPGLPGLCPGAYEAGMPHPSPQGCVYGVSRRQAGQSRTVAINSIGIPKNFGSTPG